MTITNRSFLLLSTIFFVGIFSTAAWSTVTLVKPTIASTGASNVMLPALHDNVNSANTATFYFSNIAGDFGGTNPSGVPVYSADGTTPCSLALNPHCHNLGDTFSLTVTTTAPLSGSPQMYLLYCPNSPAPGTAIAASGCTVMAEVPFTDGKAIPALTTTWGELCAKVASSAAPISDMNANCVSAANIADSVPLYLMADVNGSFTMSSEYMAVGLWIDSVIPKNSSSDKSALLGLYNFELAANLHTAVVKRLDVDASFPLLENEVGVRSVRFYYTQNSDGLNTYDPSVFNQISLLKPAGTEFFETAASETGVIQSGVIPLKNDGRYYFRAALVDMAGNVGYLTQDSDGLHHSVLVP